MPKGTPRPPFKNPFFPVVEEYEETFSEFQTREDRTRWVGSGFTGEFPHNPGSLEEKIDADLDRKIKGSY
jgi:hypothetical protein